jgi:hypothetical protein
MAYGKPGRKSKGARELLGTRPPVDLAAEARLRADELGLSINDYLLRLLAEDLGRPEYVPSPADPTRMELPIPAA